MRNLYIPTFLIACLVVASAPLQPVAKAQDHGNIVRVKRFKIIIKVPVLIVVPREVEAELDKTKVRYTVSAHRSVIEGVYEQRINRLLKAGGPYKGCYNIKVDLQLGVHFSSDGLPPPGKHEFRLSKMIASYEQLGAREKGNGLFVNRGSGDPYSVGTSGTVPGYEPTMDRDAKLSYSLEMIKWLLPQSMDYLLQIQSSSGNDSRSIVRHLGQNAEKELARHGKSLKMSEKCLRGRYERELRSHTSNAKGSADTFQRDHVQFTIDPSNPDSLVGTASATHDFQSLGSDGVVLSEHVAHSFDFAGRDYGDGLTWGLEDKDVVFEHTLRHLGLGFQQSWTKRGYDYGGLGATHEELADGFHLKVWSTTKDGVSVRHVLVVRITEAEAGDAGAVGMHIAPPFRTVERPRFALRAANTKQFPTSLLSPLISGSATHPFRLIAQASTKNEGDREPEAACCGGTLPEDAVGLIEVLSEPDVFRKRDAAQALGTMKAASADAVAALLNTLKDEDYYVRQFSAQTIGRIAPRTRRAVEALRQATKDEEPLVRIAAAEAIWRIEEDADTVLPVLTDELTAPDFRARVASAAALGQLGAAAKSAVPALQEAITTNQPAQLRINAALTLWQITDNATAATSILVEILRTDNYGLKTAAVEAIATLGPDAKSIAKDLTEILRTEPPNPGDPEAQSPAKRTQDLADLAARGVTDPGAILKAVRPRVPVNDNEEASIDKLVQLRIQQQVFIKKAINALQKIDDPEGVVAKLRLLMQSDHPLVSIEAGVVWHDISGQ